MHPELRRAARALSDDLAHDGPTPVMLRARLEAVPVRDRDAWLDIVWGADAAPEDDACLPPGCVPYLPCPVASVLDAVTQARVASDDVFVDIGAGVGRSCALAHWLTGADYIGIEIQPGLVRAARDQATRCHLDRVRFHVGEATECVDRIVHGTVFFMYCPFGRARLEPVLDALESVADHHPIRICCVDMPRLARPWLERLPSTSPDVATYASALR